MLKILEQGKYNYKPDEMIYFLKRLSQLNKNMKIKLSVHNNKILSESVNKIKKDLRGGLVDPKIGSLAFYLKELGVVKDHELWTMMGDYVMEDNFKQLFNESVNGIKGLSVLQNYLPRAKFDKIYHKIERICLITIWEVNMVHYRDIAMALAEVGRDSEQVFKTLTDARSFLAFP